MSQLLIQTYKEALLGEVSPYVSSKHSVYSSSHYACICVPEKITVYINGLWDQGNTNMSTVFCVLDEKYKASLGNGFTMTIKSMLLNPFITKSELINELIAETQKILTTFGIIEVKINNAK